MLQLLTAMKQHEVELDRLRIWDFYLTFPNEARKISFPTALSELKRVFKQKIENSYEDLIDAKKIIERMKPYQIAALHCIASYSLIDAKSLSKNVVIRTEKEIPQELLSKFEDASAEKSNIIKLVIGFAELPLYGTMGLKYRTGLIEFRYDER
ncbi:MAG: hypothetical protein LBC68_12960 [Prevotellaceae bacterium]|jgi:hypothetical protein|nr:hypothetical protein [Prevotellaceae bacterium]